MTVSTTTAGVHSASLDLGVIGNCSIAALIDRKARIVWGCFPRFDRDPVFCALINNQADDGDPMPERGVFAIELIGMTRCEQSYLDNTAILSSVLSDDHGNSIEILDFAPRFIMPANPFNSIPRRRKYNATMSERALAPRKKYTHPSATVTCPPQNLVLKPNDGRPRPLPDLRISRGKVTGSLTPRL